MKGDFSRLIHFDPRKQYSRVMEQQGRVQLDADWNEQVDILLHYLRTLAADLIGPFGAPANPDGTPGTGFKLGLTGSGDQTDLTIGEGRYYVHGLPCEAKGALYSAQPHPPDQPKLPTKPYLIYLDIWERHVTYIQDDSIREVALGGADTATRAQVVWQVRITTETADKSALTADVTCQTVRRQWARYVELWQPRNRGLLKAQARPGAPDDTDPCLSSPDAHYRGDENQLYRVEIHNGGTAGGDATFKWSSDNGSVVYPILKLEQGSGTTTVTLEHLGRDDQSGLTQGDWVEIADGEEDLRGGIDPLLQVHKVVPDTMQVILTGSLKSTIGQSNPAKPLLLRRWDHRRSASKDKPTAGGVFTVKENVWLDLEDGVQIFFDPAGGPQTYRTGDYWLIPARVATGDVEWPGPASAPESRPPHGVKHHYAPLGLWTLSPEGKAILKDCRTTFGCRAVRLDTGGADWQVVAVPASPATGPGGTDVQTINLAVPAAPATPAAPAAAPAAPTASSRPLPRAADLVKPTNQAWGSLDKAEWVSSSPDDGKDDAKTLAGVYRYELSFNLCSCFHNPGISLSVLADNSAQVFLNDQLIGERPGPEGYKVPPTLIEKTEQALFRAGRNVLRVEVKNDGGPTGFVLSGLVDADGGACC